MRLTLTVLGHTLTVALKHEDSEQEYEHDHVGGSFEVAPEMREVVYEDRVRFGFGSG